MKTSQNDILAALVTIREQARAHIAARDQSKAYYSTYLGALELLRLIGYLTDEAAEEMEKDFANSLKGIRHEKSKIVDFGNYIERHAVPRGSQGRNDAAETGGDNRIHGRK